MKTSDMIQTTKDYSIFELNFNRIETRDPFLAESMRKYGFLKSGAIHVQKNGSGKLKVVRGHHRLQEAMRQKLPVRYIVESVDVDLFDLEASTNQVWSVKNWAEARASKGDEHCAKLMAFMRKHKLSMTTASSLVGGESAGSNNKQRQIKSGTFRAGDMKHAMQVVRVIEALDEIGLPFARATNFVAAVSAALRVPEFDAELFVGHVRLYPKMISRRVGKDEYLAEIENIYNYHAQKKAFPIAYRAKEVARNRAAVKKK
jgi:hypothetical protein